MIREASLGGMFSDPNPPHYSNLPWVNPTAVEGYESTVQSQNIVHQILGSRFPDVTFRPATLRTGTLTLHFNSTQEAMRAETLHRYGQVLALDLKLPHGLSDRWTPDGSRAGNEDERRSLLGSAEMFYVVSGDVTRTLTSTQSWRLRVDYQEVDGPNARRLWGVWR
ncbi:hypothetical protein [Microbacterium dauci]|uniref:Uncharacterized protein n=1 Tax=Microbacterium dauci TaxID=3048008 RepID=A0ABT6ZGW8_9MICO|nr:hypothetical protein [Microbacterium sp. LX3-4]MDJ1115384.1 hypothetical protein [Microbacterium sp. LX3-4]